MSEPGMGFESDLSQLNGVARWRVPQVAMFFEHQAHRFAEFEGLGDREGWASSLNSVFGELADVLRHRASDAAGAVRATADALQDVADLYRRADGQS